MILNQQDSYAMARALAGLDPHPAVPTSPLVGMMIEQFAGRTPTQQEIEMLRGVFGQTLISQVFAVDPHGAAPVSEEMVTVPALPETALLSEEMVQEGAKAGKLLDVWMSWANEQASMTDDLFLESGFLWLIGLACARRVRLKLDFQMIYNNHYMLWTAPTTYYRKSTGLRVVERVVRNIMPEFLLAGQSSPEMLLHKLAGNRATNYEELDPEAQAMENKGRQFAGQRGFISDEMSKLFSKKYMEGLPEVLMEMAEAPALVEHEYKGSGKLVVRNAGLSLLFATTPARLQRIFGDGEWEDGLLPRFALLTPSSSVVNRTPARRRSKAHGIAPLLDQSLRRLITQLPQPRDVQALDDGSSPLAGAVDAVITDGALDLFNNYATAMHDMTDPRGGLDYRLAGVYGRLPVHVLRIALSLAAADWAMQGCQGVITVMGAHWARGQGIGEAWRASSHRLLADVNRGQDQINEEKILSVLRKRQPMPPTKYQVYRLSGIANRRDAYGAIDALVEAGVLAQVQSGQSTGYELVKAVRV